MWQVASSSRSTFQFLCRSYLFCRVPQLTTDVVLNDLFLDIASIKPAIAMARPAV